jgi:hypothetical protein
MKNELTGFQLIKRAQHSLLNYLDHKYNMLEYQRDEISDMIFNCLVETYENMPLPYFNDCIGEMQKFIKKSDFRKIYNTSVDYNDSKIDFTEIVGKVI